VSAANRPRIVLHVGAPKTASTYIQRRLRTNAERLRRNGIYVPVLSEVAEMAGNAKLLPTALGQRPSLTFQRAFPKIDIAALDAKKIVGELLQDWRSASESVILSAENLRPIHARPMRELLPKSAPCAVILFVRRQDRWLDSYFNQMIKTNEIHENISAFLDRLLAGKDERLCRPDWFSHYEAWREAFGKCEVVFYDEITSDVFSAFLKASGFGPIPDLIDIDRAQVSLNLYELGYLLEKSPVDYADFLRRKSAAEKASRRSSIRDNRSVLSESDLSRLRAAFGESNRRLIAALGRSDTALRLNQAWNQETHCSLSELYASESYGRYRKIADAVYARRNRRDRIRSFFK
jgi:hypothetical protein